MTYYYSCEEDGDDIMHDSVDEAVTEYLSQMLPEDWPRTVEVYRYERCVVSDESKGFLAGRILDQAIEDLDEDYGNPEQETKVTKEMRALAQEYVEKLTALYHVWRCDNVGPTQEIDVVEWVRKSNFTGDDENHNDDIEDALARLEAEDE